MVTNILPMQPSVSSLRASPVQGAVYASGEQDESNSYVGASQEKESSLKGYKNIYREGALRLGGFFQEFVQAIAEWFPHDSKLAKNAVGASWFGNGAYLVADTVEEGRIMKRKIADLNARSAPDQQISDGKANALVFKETSQEAIFQVVASEMFPPWIMKFVSNFIKEGGKSFTKGADAEKFNLLHSVHETSKDVFGGMFTVDLLKIDTGKHIWGFVDKLFGFSRPNPNNSLHKLVKSMEHKNVFDLFAFAASIGVMLIAPKVIDPVVDWILNHTYRPLVSLFIPDDPRLKHKAEAAMIK